VSGLALILATPPEVGDLARAAGLAAAARRRGLAVGLFAMDHGVRSLAAAPAVVAAMLDDGCDVIACATSADALGIDAAALGAQVGSQDDHAALCHRADRVVAFT